MSNSYNPKAINRAIEVLNTALEADPTALQELFNVRVPCNMALVAHPTVQVRLEDIPANPLVPETPLVTVGVLGIINGLFGVDEKLNGYICSVTEADGQIVKFARYKDAQVELKEV